MMMKNGLSLMGLQLVEPACPECMERGEYERSYRKTVCPGCGKNLRRGAKK